MTTAFLHSFQAEWLKRKRSAASALVLGGAFFIPVIMVIIQLVYHDTLAVRNIADNFWEDLFLRSWESMSFALLPMGVILATSLLAQLEYKNNAWKQVHTSPQSLTVVFFAKLAVILLMMFLFLVLFHVGIYASAILPAWLIPGAPLPVQSFPWTYFLEATGQFFIAALPIIAIQQLISLHYRNFLASVGVGLGFVVASLFALKWKYGYFVPFTHTAIQYIRMSHPEKVETVLPLYALSLIYFLVFISFAYLLYITKKEKG